jgi:hypothetical protein
MKTKFLFLAMALSAGVLFTNCKDERHDRRLENAREEVRDEKVEAREEIHDAEGKFQKEWEDFKVESQDRIRDNELEIKRYRDDAVNLNMSKSERLEYDNKITRLEDRNAELKRKMDEYDRETDKAKRREKWESFKAEFNRDMNELGEAFKNLGRDNKDNVK